MHFFVPVITGDLSKNCSHSDIAGEIRDCEVTQASKHFRGGLSEVSGKKKKQQKCPPQPEFSPQKSRNCTNDTLHTFMLLLSRRGSTVLQTFLQTQSSLKELMNPQFYDALAKLCNIIPELNELCSFCLLLKKKGGGSPHICSFTVILS